jgi:hypothetical protein
MDRTTPEEDYSTGGLRSMSTYEMQKRRGVKPCCGVARDIEVQSMQASKYES